MKWTSAIYSLYLKIWWKIWKCLDILLNFLSFSYREFKYLNLASIDEGKRIFYSNKKILEIDIPKSSATLSPLLSSMQIVPFECLTSSADVFFELLCSHNSSLEHHNRFDDAKSSLPTATGRNVIQLLMCLEGTIPFGKTPTSGLPRSSLLTFSYVLRSHVLGG